MLMLLLVACGGNQLSDFEAEENTDIIGFTTVPLDLNRAVVRVREAAAGNLVTDAMLERLVFHGHVLDAAFVNGGNLRFNVQNHPDGIIPAGELLQRDIDNLLPFGNLIVVLRLSGTELKSTLERSVAQLPSTQPHGAFLQLSQTLRLEVDLSRQAQILDTTSPTPVIALEGERIITVTIRGLPMQNNAEYLVAFPDFIANGGDGYVTLATVGGARRIDTGLLLVALVTEHVTLFSPISPALDGRIRYVGEINPVAMLDENGAP